MECFNASREDVQNLFSYPNEIKNIFVDDNNTGYVEVMVCGKKYKISNQRTRNLENIKKIKSVFGENGYEIVSI